MSCMGPSLRGAALASLLSPCPDYPRSIAFPEPNHPMPAQLTTRTTLNRDTCSFDRARTPYMQYSASSTSTHCLCIFTVFPLVISLSPCPTHHLAPAKPLERTKLMSSQWERTHHQQAQRRKRTTPVNIQIPDTTLPTPPSPMQGWGVLDWFICMMVCMFLAVSLLVFCRVTSRLACCSRQ
jgi:hypothetical protein